MRPLAALLMLLTLGGCASESIHSEFIDGCAMARMVLHSDAARIRNIGAFAIPGALPGVRLAYRVEEPDEPARGHELVCRFAGVESSADRSNLVSATLDGEPLSDTRLYILKRWWLDDALARRNALEAEMQARDGVPEVPMALGYGLQQVFNGLSLAAIYALGAVSFALIYGLTGTIMLAFGDIIMAGGYGALIWIAATLLVKDKPLVLALPLGLIMAMTGTAMLSYALGRLVVAPVIARAPRPGRAVLVVTLAASIVLSEGLRLFEGPDARWIPALGTEPIALVKAGTFIVTITANQVLATILALLTGLSALVLMRASAFGRAWRASADDPAMVTLLGIDADALLRASFVMAGTLAGVGGFIHTFHYGTAHYAIGLGLGIKALCGAILGGIGSVGGAFAGGLIIGLVEAGWSAVLPIGWKDVVIYTLIVLILQVRPGGLFGYADRGPRQV